MSSTDRRLEVFERLCDLEPAAADAELARIAASDPELAAAVGALLAADRRSGVWIDGPVVEAMRGLEGFGPIVDPDRIADGEPRPRVGRYEIVGTLGHGGMGVVYEARQSAPERAVALKLLRPGLLSEDRLRRFEHEARVLGRLNHPGIAQVYEAGTARVGSTDQPFIAMELVRGERLDLHAVRRRPSLRERIGRIIELCDAVQHAHDQGVVHRDLKPANLLVSERGPLKVLDFGVARIVGADVEALTQMTGTGQVLGTLPYMSPEQVRGTRADVDARSDVYAIGVIAYELLSGKRPLQLESCSLPEAARIIAEDEPTTLGRLDRRLRGDLEILVGKALAKEPERRFATPRELAAELQRHLDDEPIKSRPPSRAYRIQKFTRRHRELVLGVALAFAVLLAGGVTSTVLYFRSQGNLARAVKAEGDWREAAQRAALAEAEWQEAARRAGIEAGLAGEVSDFLVRLFEVSDPSGQAGAHVTALELLDRGRQEIATELADQPDVRRRLMSVMGRVYFQLGQYGRALPLIGETLAALRASEDPAPLELADALFAIGEIHHFQGDIQEIRPYYEEALALRRTSLPPAHPDVTRSIDVLARLFRDLQTDEDLERAHGLAQEAYDLRREGGASEFELSESLQTLASLETHAGGDLREARRLNLEALAIRERLQEGDSKVAFRTPELLHALGDVEFRLGNDDRAEELYRQCLEQSRERFGPDHVFVSHSLRGLAGVHTRHHRYDEAEACLDEALRLTTDADRGIRNLLLQERAFVEHDRGGLEQAAQLYEEAIEECAAREGPDHPDTAVAINNLCTLRYSQGRYDEVEALALEAIDIFRKSSPDHPTLGKTLRNAAGAIRQQGRAREAIPFAIEGERRYAERYGEGSPEHAMMVHTLIEVLDAAGEREQAAEWRARLAG